MADTAAAHPWVLELKNVSKTFVNPDGTVAALVAEPGVTAESLAATAEDAFGLELA